MKTIVTTLCLILALCSTNKAVSQPAPHQVFFEAGTDLSMPIKGAYPDREGSEKIKGFDFLLGIGIEWDHIRLSNQIQSFQKIGFFKWTFAKADYKTSLFKNVNGFIGLECSQLKRLHDQAIHYNNPENVFGANAEIQYRKNNLAFSAQLNIHEAEEDLKPYKDYRWQVHAKAIIYF